MRTFRKMALYLIQLHIFVQVGITELIIYISSLPLWTIFPSVMASKYVLLYLM